MARSEQARQETHDVPAPRAGKAHHPRPREDRARRRIAYLLIALLALLVVALPAMVVFDVIPVGEIKEFGVILGPLVALVSAATGFYYAGSRQRHLLIALPTTNRRTARFRPAISASRASSRV